MQYGGSREAPLAALLFAGGVASLVYGAMYHAVPVERNSLSAKVSRKSTKSSATTPSRGLFRARRRTAGFPGHGHGPSPGGPLSARLPFPGTSRPKIKVIVTRPVRRRSSSWSWRASRSRPRLEVTLGGVVLAESGLLRRTYGPTESGEEVPPPSRCPT